MTEYYNRIEEKGKRRRLRNNLTAPEVILWSRIKNRQVLGYKFRRQFSVGKYVVDFYCPELKLAIELDGESHFVGHGPEKDKKKADFPIARGIEVLRVTNYEVRRNLNGVLEYIYQTIMVRARVVPPYPPNPSTTPPTPPSQGGENGLRSEPLKEINPFPLIETNCLRENAALMESTSNQKVKIPLNETQRSNTRKRVAPSRFPPP